MDEDQITSDIQDQDNDDSSDLRKEMRERMREVGKRVRILRSMHGMTQIELSVLVYGDESFNSRISNLETGRSVPAEAVMKVGDVFDVPAWQLLHPGFKIKTVVEIDTGE